MSGSLRIMQQRLSKLMAYTSLMRLNKPVGIFLLLWPTLCALWIAGAGTPSIKLVLIFITGVVLTRSAGCVINDLLDRRFDRAVERTQFRPMVTGKISTKSAIFLFVLLCLLAALLLLPLNSFTRYLAIPAVILMTVYPLMKRYIYFPQLIMGVAFSWGVLMAFAAQTNTLPPSAWILFFITCLWAIAYDTIYAMVDRNDDVRVGVKSTAILFGRWDTKIIALLHTVMLILLVILGVALSLNVYYYLGLFLAILIIIYQHYLIKDRDRHSCFQAFVRTPWVGLFIFLGLLFSF